MREAAPPDAPAEGDRFERDLLDTPQAGPAAIRGSLLRVGGYGAGLLLSVLSVSLLIRHLGVDDFGRYVTVISLVTIVQGITDAGLSQIGVREYSIRSGRQRADLMRNLMGVRLALTVVGILGATLFALAVGYTSTQVLGTMLVGAGLVLTVTQGTLAVPLSSQLRLGWVSGIELLRQTLTVLGVVAGVVAGASLLAFFTVPIPVGVVVLAATVVLVRGTMPMRPAFDLGEWRILLRAVLPYAGAVAIASVYLRVTVVLVSLLASAAETGYYATAYRVTEVLIAIPALVVGSTLPVLARAARDDPQRLRYVLERLFQATLIFGAWLAVTVAVGAAFAIQVLAGSRSQPSIPVLHIQAVALLFTFVATSFQYGLLSLHRHRDLLAISVLALVVSVALTLGLVPVLDARGAAVAFAAGEGTVCALSLAFLRRASGELSFPARTVGSVALAALAALSTLLVPGLPSVVRAVVGTVLFFAVMLGLRAIPAELTDAVLRWRQTRWESTST